jgi:hypothetical protein
MSEQIAEIIELRHIRPMKWSTLDKKVESKVKPFRVALVSTFLKYEGTPLLHEDGSPMMGSGQKQPRQLEVSARNFAARYGIAQVTFNEWVVGVRGITQPWQQRGKPRADTARIHEAHGRCSHCPEWTEE